MGSNESNFRGVSWLIEGHLALYTFCYITVYDVGQIGYIDKNTQKYYGCIIELFTKELRLHERDYGEPSFTQRDSI